MNYEEIKNKIRKEIEKSEELLNKPAFYDYKKDFIDGEIFAYKQILIWLALVELPS